MRRALALGLVVVLTWAPIALAASSGSVRGAVRIVPITVGLVVEPSSAATGASVRAKAMVVNASTSVTASVRLELRLDRVGVLVKAEAGKTSFTLKPGKSTTVSWNLCGRVAGTYVVLARAETEGVFVDSPARLLTIRAGPKTCK
ncbi:MAG TPA: hypothetical protein VFV72_02140 [Candidatus Limnocylindrales bacterium]|nr:hypothetical protein [Candidatus Limnocylindrales bacterium]